jgi:hypothetical protein
MNRPPVLTVRDMEVGWLWLDQPLRMIFNHPGSEHLPFLS